MPDLSKTQEAEKKIQAALAEARELLGAATPRLINEKPQVESHAIRHGLTGQSAFLPVIQLRDYLIIGAEFIEEMRPIGVGEMQLAQQIIDTNWRLNAAMSYQTIVNHSHVVLESQALYAAHPEIEPRLDLAGSDELLMHAQAIAIQKQCEGSNTLDKLSRYETRLRRALREMRKDYYALCDRRPKPEREAWEGPGCRHYTWYRTLANLVGDLIVAREELAEKSVEELAPVTEPESASSEKTLFRKKTLRLTAELTLGTIETLNRAYIQHLLTETEVTLFPLSVPLPESEAA